MTTTPTPARRSDARADHDHGHGDPSRLTLKLDDGGSLTTTALVPRDVAARRAAVAGAQLYVFAGLLCAPWQPPTNILAGYIGISSQLYRADASYTRWVTLQRRLYPTGMALLHHDTRTYPRDQLLYVEARLIQSLSALHNIATLNSQSAANLAGARLNRDQLLDAMTLADTLTDLIHRQLYGNRDNPDTAPAGNSREAAVRAVRSADRALDIDDITELLTAAQWHQSASTPGRSIRRDLTQRIDRGRPHVHVAWHRRQRVWFHPGLTKRQAIAGYDRAKPPRRCDPKPARSCRTSLQSSVREH